MTTDKHYCRKNHVCHWKSSYQMCPSSTGNVIENNECYHRDTFSTSDTRVIHCLNRMDAKEKIFKTTVFNMKKRLPLLNSFQDEFKFDQYGMVCGDTFLNWTEADMDKIYYGQVDCNSHLLDPVTLLRLIRNDQTFTYRKFASKSL